MTDEQTKTAYDVDVFTRSYMETALWSSTIGDDQGTSLDQDHDIDDISPETLAKMQADCKEFQAANAADIADNLDDAGHDFWLTRNGHGAGFWDGDWQPKERGKRLSEASEVFGFCTLILGDNGEIELL